MTEPTANYTLPGVMHYLQMEYTKNERDRIMWELERSEMKCRIAQLEGENKMLREQLGKTSGAPVQPEKYSESKARIQDSVKEIVYLLKSCTIAQSDPLKLNDSDIMHSLSLAHRSSITKLAASDNQLLSYSSDGILKHGSLSESIEGLVGMFWLNETSFVTVTHSAIDLWNSSTKIVSQSVEDIITCDFSNGSLIVSNGIVISVYKIDSQITLQNEFRAAATTLVMGITEKSLLAYDSAVTCIFDFLGNKLQEFSVPKGASSVVLNRKNSKLFFVVADSVSVYSFDTRKTTLMKIPGISSFASRDDLYAVGFQSGRCQVRNVMEDTVVYEFAAQSAITALDLVKSGVVYGTNDGIIRVEKL